MLAFAPTAGAQESEQPVKLLVLGTSLTAGYGLAPEDGFTERLQVALWSHGHNVRVLNGGVSGDTSSGGLSRLEWSLGDDPDFVLVELGSNDGLRGIDPDITRDNLDQILAILAGAEVPTMLAGMYAPPNFGSDYGRAFNAIYPDLAAAYDVPLYPFFLEGVALVPELNQADGIHPNRAGVDRIVDGILEPLMEAMTAAGVIAG